MAGKSRTGVYVAAFALLGGLALAMALFTGTRPAPVPPPSPAPLIPPAPESAAPPADPAPPEVLAAKAELRAEYTRQKAKIPEDVAKPIENDIGIIEGVAADLLAAIASEPDNEDLKMMLIETYRNEMKLLKKALHLSGSEDDAAPAEAPAPDQ